MEVLEIHFLFHDRLALTIFFNSSHLNPCGLASNAVAITSTEERVSQMVEGLRPDATHSQGKLAQRASLNRRQRAEAFDGFRHHSEHVIHVGFSCRLQ